MKLIPWKFHTPSGEAIAVIHSNLGWDDHDDHARSQTAGWSCTPGCSILTLTSHTTTRPWPIPTDMAEHDTQQNYEIYEAAMVFSGCHMWWFPIYVHMWWFQRDSHPFIACDHFFEGASGVIMAVASWRIPPRLMTSEAIDGRFILLMSYIIYHHVTSHKNLSIDHWIPLEASFMTVSLTFFPPWHRSGELDLGEGRIPHSGPALWPLGDVDAMWCRCHVVPVMPFFMFVDELGMGQYL